LTVNVIDMYKKITLIILMLFVIVYSEEISVKNVTQANFLSLRLSTIVPYSLHNDQNFTKNNTKRSLFLIIPPLQTRNDYKEPKEMVQKMKRCGTLSKKNKFLSLARKKEDSIRAEMKVGSLDRNIKIPRQNSNARTLLKNIKYLQEIPANKKKAETYKDNTFLRALKNNMNAENVILNLESQEKKKKCNTENCICYCKEENCFSKSSMKNSSEILSSPRKDKLEKINRQKAKEENIKSNVLHQTSPKLYHKSLQELQVPNLINSFPTFYQERIHPMNIPRAPILQKTLPYIIRNEKKFDNIPFPSFENRPNFLLKSNAYNQYHPIIHRNLHPCPRTDEENRIESPTSTTSSSTSYVGATIRQQTENDLKSMETIGKDEKYFFKLTTETPNNFVSINSETETNFYPSYSVNKIEESSITDISNLDGITYKLKNSTEKTKENQEDDFSKLMPFFTNYIDRSRTPSIIYPSIMQNEKLINMEECIKLFGRDVCVLSATSPEVLAKQIPKNNINEYSTIRIPEYIMQMSTKEGTTNNVNYLDKFKTIDTYVESKSSTSGIKTSNIDLNEYLESTNVDLNEYLESTNTELILIDSNEKFPQEFKLFNIKEDTHMPMKKLMDQITDKTMEIERNTLLGKSKSHVKPLLNSNNKEALNPSSSEKYLYSTNSYEYNNDKELDNLKIDQQTLATLADININSWSTLGVQNTDRKEEPTTKIFQEQLEEKIIPISSDSNTEYNFEETTENDSLEKTIYFENEILQKQPVTQYLDEKTNYLNNKEDITNRPETTIDLPSKILPYCDNTLLLNSIRNVINDFTSNTFLTETKDLNENILQKQDRNLLPEISQIPNLENILSIPQTENTIVEKVKDVLPDITAILKRNFTGDRSLDMIKNSFHSILQTFSANFHQKLPSMTVEEHQFKDGQWTINPITLASVPDSKLSIANPVNLQKSKNLLNSSAIASQADQYMRNMIAQSVKSSLTKDEHKEIDNSIIHVLNNILQTVKDLEDTKSTKIDNEKVQMISYQEPKALENNASMIISNFLDLTEYEKDESIEEKTSRKIIYKTDKNVRNQILNGIQKIDTQDNEEKELAESLKTTYHKAISQNNLSMSAIPVESNLIKAEKLNTKEKNVFLETTIISPIITKNLDQTENDIVTLTPRIKDINVNNNNNKSLINDSLDNQVLKYTQNYHINEENVQITTMPTNFIQKTSSNYAQMSNDIISENMEEIEDIENKTEFILNREILTKLPDNLISSTDIKYRKEKSKIASSTDEIDPAIILERIEHNLSPIKYYSPEILKYIKNHHNADAFISVIQETLPDHAQMSDSIISQNITSTKNIGNEESILNEKISTISIDDVISSLNVDYGNYEAKITPSTDNNVLDSQQQDFKTNNIIAKIYEATTEVQQTYAKTTYLKVKSSADNRPMINISSSTYKADANSNNDNKDKNSSIDNDNLIGNKMYNADITTNDNIITETNNVTISSFKSCLLNDTNLVQLFPSLITSDISELEKSQLYYINDSMKLPFEIRKLKDGSYVLSITKDICEQKKILERKCPCCVPLQEHVILWNKNQNQKDVDMMTSSQEDMYVNDDKKDYYLTESPNMITIMTGKNILRMQKLGEEKERMSAHYHWKQNLNDKNLITILMPVIDCTKKYNLFNSKNQKRNPPFKSIDISKEDTKINNEEMKSDKYRIVDFEKGNVTVLEKEKERKPQHIIEYENRERIPISKIIISGDNVNMKSEKTSRDKLTNTEKGNVFYKKKKKEHKMRMIDNKQNDSRIKISAEDNKKPYRYQRNTSGILNRRAELVKSILYWLKGLFSNK
ncbi:uncharacterized protein PF11_0213-like, partial [Camponotus floridanus]|uniref:uncharacterized protein PF11_0213-like n=1 Tax=Camponotus floridanus TaxID=104421 RepID=UPI000DC6B391